MRKKAWGALIIVGGLFAAFALESTIFPWLLSVLVGAIVWVWSLAVGIEGPHLFVLALGGIAFALHILWLTRQSHRPQAAAPVVQTKTPPKDPLTVAAQSTIDKEAKEQALLKRSYEIIDRWIRKNGALARSNRKEVFEPFHAELTEALEGVFNKERLKKHFDVLEKIATAEPPPPPREAQLGPPLPSSFANLGMGQLPFKPSVYRYRFTRCMDLLKALRAQITIYDIRDDIPHG